MANLSDSRPLRNALYPITITHGGDAPQDQDDAVWFRENLNRGYRLRPAFPGEDGPHVVIRCRSFDIPDALIEPHIETVRGKSRADLIGSARHTAFMKMTPLQLAHISYFQRFTGDFTDMRDDEETTKGLFQLLRSEWSREYDVRMYVHMFSKHARKRIRVGPAKMVDEILFSRSKDYYSQQ